MPKSRIALFLLALFCPSYALHAGEPESINIKEQHSQDTAPNFTIAASGGTQGLGMSVGYRFNPYIGVRLRGARISYDRTDDWGSHKAHLSLNGDNAGLLIDIFPFGGQFYLCAGLTYCESTMRYRARYHRTPGEDCHIRLGGLQFQLVDDTTGELSGKCSWDKLQPYIGLGYTDTLFDGYPLYYAIDLGINYMGSSTLRTSNKGHFTYQDQRTYQWKDITDAQLNRAIRTEARDFFKIADKLHVYPVLQLSLGLQF